MTTKDVVTLAGAGFSAEQIKAFAQLSANETKQNLHSAYGIMGQQTAQPAGNMSGAGTNLADLLTAIQKSTQPEPKTAEDVLLEVINPTTGAEVK